MEKFEDFQCLRSRLVGLVTFDIGRIASSELVLDRLRSKFPRGSSGFLELNERFFDHASGKPLVVLREPVTTISDVIPNEAVIPARFREEIVEACALLKNVPLTRTWFISSTGVGAFFFYVEPQQSTTTGQLIAATNVLVKYDSSFAFEDGSHMDVRNSIAAIRAALEPCI